MSDKINVSELANTASALYIAVRAKAEEDAMKEALDTVIHSCKLKFFGGTIESAGIIAQDSVFPDQATIMFPVKFENDPIQYTFYADQKEIDHLLEEAGHNGNDFPSAFIVATAQILAKKLAAEMINQIKISGGFDYLKVTSDTVDRLRGSGIFDLLGK